MTIAELREQYPELSSERLVNVDIVDDAQTLSKFPTESEDFVIANHFLEHVQDPIGALENFFRVLKPGGIVLLALPDKRVTFDRDRESTSWEHLLEDHADGGVISRRGHFEEWVKAHNGLQGQEAEPLVARLMDMDYSIHYHAWIANEMLEMVLKLSTRLGFEIELVNRDGIEVVFILRKAEKQ